MREPKFHNRIGSDFFLLVYGFSILPEYKKEFLTHCDGVDDQ